MNLCDLQKDDDTLVTDQRGILREQTKFFKALYSKDADVHFSLRPDNNENVLNNIDKTILEEEFSDAEFFDGMMTLKRGKVCGCDGLSVEFYHHFWKLLSPYLIRMYRHSYHMGKLNQVTNKG